jgi:hypothetical protein
MRISTNTTVNHLIFENFTGLASVLKSHHIPMNLAELLRLGSETLSEFQLSLKFVFRSSECLCILNFHTAQKDLRTPHPAHSA